MSVQIVAQTPIFRTQDTYDLSSASEPIQSVMSCWISQAKPQQPVNEKSLKEHTEMVSRSGYAKKLPDILVSH